jgi:hypothetical protein
VAGAAGLSVQSCPVSNVHVGVSFFKGELSAVGGILLYMICVNGMPKKDTVASFV